MSNPNIDSLKDSDKAKDGRMSCARLPQKNDILNTVFSSQISTKLTEKQSSNQGLKTAAQPSTLPKISTVKLNTDPNNLNSTQKNLEAIITQNIPYFAHIQRVCVCGLCTCGHCRCNAPKNLKITLNDSCMCSDYRANFPGAVGKPPANLKQKEPLYQHKDGNMATIYKHDFIRPDPRNFKMFQESVFIPSHVKNGDENSLAPFSKNSNYRENYINYNVNLPHVMFRPSQVSTTDPRLPFFGQVTNKEYGKFDPKDVEQLIDGKKFAQSQYKNPINAEVAIGDRTCHQEAYQPYKDFEAMKRYSPVDELPVELEPAFKNQFKSSTSSHDGTQNKVCPASVILKKMKVARKC